jgi:hypothetical protein
MENLVEKPFCLAFHKISNDRLGDDLRVNLFEVRLDIPALSLVASHNTDINSALSQLLTEAEADTIGPTCNDSPAIFPIALAQVARRDHEFEEGPQYFDQEQYEVDSPDCCEEVDEV